MQPAQRVLYDLDGGIEKPLPLAYGDDDLRLLRIQRREFFGMSAASNRRNPESLGRKAGRSPEKILLKSWIFGRDCLTWELMVARGTICGR